MKILAIETSCDDTSVAVVEDGKHVVYMKTVSQHNAHKLFGGIVPEIASRKHLDVIYDLTREVLQSLDTNIENSLKQVGAIAVTFTPGLTGSLLVGLNFAKGICLANNIALVGVHHLKAHVAANYIDNKGIKPPFLCLLVSGGHTCIVKAENYIKFRVIGKTRDDAVGEVFDKITRISDIPDCLNIDMMAKDIHEENKEIKFTIPKLENFDFSFSGMKTQAINYIKSKKKAGEVAFNLRHTVFKYLTEKLLEAAKKNNCNKVAISGGVASNLYLREMILKECRKNKIDFYAPEPKYCTDNAAMIGVQGYFEFINGNISQLDLNAYDSKSEIAKMF
ncbi:MAG: tRNA (adenosine(37)-N6)-threonylcarbamoyltransferase complex transferase subunit TsaD [Candidatus Improbicoccus pseudotrichonymphae]|uniref:tRNA N6-adenosine threonylcarbamoyltransferase n=1 Tax=Candidatus Improbicoccus pseudotrichonymphae TaxID=3033792 RepID=A0AA48HUY3_9FIRM|nr:MAG: tRNA (adenosine(37)-N6)-threonylcarbamoyltransferase complex transferase subunit TsaD [Candidatus Improbicoccus pseudotrichonymphae]